MSGENTEIKVKRKPRFTRVNNARFRLQERDIEMIKLVYKYRFLTSSHLVALIPGSYKGILRRLHLLYHSGFLDRPKEQIRPYRNGSNVLIYALGNRGADILFHDFGIHRNKIDWTTKNREVKRIYLEHKLCVSNFMVVLEVACRLSGNIRIIEPDRFFDKMPVLKIRTLRRINGNVKNYSFSLTPDGVFGLHFLNDPLGQNKAFFLLEADKSTMPIKRRDFFRSSIERKLVGYWECWQKDLFKKTYGFEKARILNLAISQERILNMIKACGEIDPKGNGSKLFLFSLASNFNLKSVDNVLAPVWQNGCDDQLVSLVD